MPQDVRDKVVQIDAENSQPVLGRRARPRWYPRVPSRESRLVNTPPRARSRARGERRGRIDIMSSASVANVASAVVALGLAGGVTYYVVNVQRAFGGARAREDEDGRTRSRSTAAREGVLD